MATMADEGKVVFTNNTIDATKLQGGYVKWQLEGGTMVDPAQQVTKGQSYATKKLTCYMNETKDEYEYQGEIELSYDASEPLDMTGPNEGIITISGQDNFDSSKKSNWKKGEGKSA